MRKLKAGLVVAGIAASALALRNVKRRRTETPREEAQSAAAEALEEATIAAEHAAAAAGHARVAGEKALEYGSEEVRSRRSPADGGGAVTESSQKSRSRLRRTLARR